VRLIHFFFGLSAYAAFHAVFIYFAGFLANFQVPKSINTPVVGNSIFQSLAIDVVLIALFAVHHSAAPRAFFKKWLQKHIPAHLERSVYVMMSSILLALLMWQWMPVTQEIWRVEDSFGKFPITVLFVAGVVSALVASFHIDHYDLFGMRQVYCHLRNLPYTPPIFNEKGLYKVVRHPIMLGTLVVLWATPVMTVGHFLFAISMSLYIFIGTFLEERDLLVTLGGTYGNYQKRVPMIVPFFRGRRPTRRKQSAAEGGGTPSGQ